MGDFDLVQETDEGFISEKDTIHHKAKKSINMASNSKDRTQRMLKQACEVLEEQLVVFEEKCEAKNEECRKLEAIIKTLEATTEGLKEDLRDATENQEFRFQELLGEIKELKARCVELVSENEHLTGVVENLRTECTDHREDAHKMVTQFVREKCENGRLEDELDGVINTCEEYKQKIETLESEILALQLDKTESEAKFEGMLQQKIRLIEHLQGQIEVLSRKKSFVDRVLGRNGGENKENKEKETIN